MSDIVQRLRDSVRACRAIGRSALLAEAADEIQRLLLSGTERVAIEELAGDPDFYGLTKTHTRVLRGLLERTK